MSKSGAINQWAWQTLPAGWTGAAPPTLPQRITGTGPTESSQAVALTPGQYYIVKNVSASITARFAGAQASGLSTVVNATTSPTLTPGQEYKFFCTEQTRFVYAEATGTDVYDLIVWRCDAVSGE